MSSTSHHASVGTVALALVTGVLIAVQSLVNGQLSRSLDSALEASCISFGSGFLILLLLSLASAPLRAGLREIPIAVRSGRLPRWHTIGGAIGATFVIIQTYAVPVIGIAIFSVATIGGQTAMSMLVDRLGLRAGIKHPVTLRRALTGGITVLAVVVSVSDRLGMPSASLLAPALGLLSGAGIAVQRALNAHVNDFARHSFATTWWNFMMGTGLLFVASSTVLLRGGQFSALPGTPWWMYLGGVVGVIYIAISNIVVQRVGALMFTALSVGGQLAASLAFDLFRPSSTTMVGPHIYAGVLLSLVGIAIGTIRRRVA